MAAQRRVLAMSCLLLVGACCSCARNTVSPQPTLPSSNPVLTPAPISVAPPPVNRSSPPLPAPRALPVVKSNPWKPTAKERDWKFIVIHHTASTHGSVESINEEHQKKKDKSGNPWLGIGYHFVIGNGEGMDDGDIEPTFRWRTQIQGAHAGSADKDYNEKGIGICLVGNFENVPPSPKQRAAVTSLVRELKSAYRISTANVVGHKDVRAGGTECPGKLFPLAEVAEAKGVSQLVPIQLTRAARMTSRTRSLTP